MRLGPFEVHFAKNAPVAHNQYDVVMFSHGNSGYYRNHHTTAAALARAGYIVIAPQHRADFMVGGRKTAQALYFRAEELRTAYNAVATHDDFKLHIRPDHVHGAGYSLGAVTCAPSSLQV